MNYHKILFTIVASTLVLAVPAVSHALTISPPVIEANIDPGSEIVQVIKIVNTDSEPQIFYLSAADFTASGEKGEPKILTSEETPSGYTHGLSGWLKFSDNEIFLPALEKAEIKVTIRVPATAEPGGHYGAVFFESKPPEVTGKVNVGVVSKIGTLMLVRVSGDVKEQGLIANFNTQPPKSRFDHRPINFITRFENQGNVHLKPQGQVDIYNTLGRLVGTLAVNENGGNVLPQSTRLFEADWATSKAAVPLAGNFVLRFWQELQNEKQGFALGKYTAYLSLHYGVNNKAVTSSREFWIFPWRLILITLIILIITVLSLTTGVKRYNRWVLRRARK